MTTIPQRRYSLNSADEEAAMIRNRRFTTGAIRADERARPMLLRRFHPSLATTPLSSQALVNVKELESRVNQLEDNWNRVNELVVGGKTQRRQSMDSSGGRDFQTKDSQISVNELWTYVTMDKKVQANTDGVTKVHLNWSETVYRMSLSSSSS